MADSIKDRHRYEALRDEGMSKEKAARIANSDPHTTGKRGGHSPPLDEMSKDDLYQRAKKIGIEGRSKMNKSQLVHAIRNH